MAPGGWRAVSPWWPPAASGACWPSTPVADTRRASADCWHVCLIPVASRPIGNPIGQTTWIQEYIRGIDYSRFVVRNVTKVVFCLSSTDNSNPARTDFGLLITCSRCFPLLILARFEKATILFVQWNWLLMLRSARWFPSLYSCNEQITAVSVIAYSWYQRRVQTVVNQHRLTFCELFYDTNSLSCTAEEAQSPNVKQIHVYL